MDTIISSFLINFRKMMFLPWQLFKLLMQLTLEMCGTNYPFLPFAVKGEHIYRTQCLFVCIQFISVVFMFGCFCERMDHGAQVRKIEWMDASF